MIPVHLQLENFMSHTRSEIDFGQFDMALIVGSDHDNPDVSNGIGKSAIFNAMLWAMYGKCRFSTKKKVIKRGKSSCSVAFSFDLDGSTYRIVRQASKRASSSEIQFLVREGAGAGWRDLSRDTPTATNAKIEETIGMNHDTFINSVYFGQFDVSRFAAATATQKKAILKEILQIGEWDKYQDAAKGHLRKLDQQLEILDDRIKTMGDLDKLRQDNRLAIETAKLALEDAKTAMTEKEAALDAARREIAEHEAAMRALGDVPAQRKRFDEREKVVAGRCSHLKQAVISNNERLAAVARETSGLKEAVSAAAARILVLSSHRDRELAEEIYARLTGEEPPRPLIDREQARTVSEEAAECERRIGELRLRIGQMDALEPGEQCPCCLMEIEDLGAVVDRREKKRKFLENQLSEQEVLLRGLKDSITRCSDAIGRAISAAADMRQGEARLRSLEDDGLKATQANAACQKEFAFLECEWKQLREERKALDDAADADMLRHRLEAAIRMAEAGKAGLETARRKVLELGMEYGNLKGHAEDLKRRMSERDTLLARKPRLAQEYEIYKRLVRAFSKDGVPAIIMENVTEDLRNYANEILRGICGEPLMIDFIMQSRTETGSWTETFDIAVSGGDRTGDDFKDLSGGEQVRVSIALRLALSKILMRRVGSNIKFLLLDEVDQALDRQGIQALADILRTLSRRFKVMLITHNDSMKDMFDHIITVRKGPAGSTVRQAAA